MVYYVCGCVCTVHRHVCVSLFMLVYLIHNVCASNTIKTMYWLFVQPHWTQTHIHTHMHSNTLAHTSNYECPSALVLPFELLLQQLLSFQLPSYFMCSIYRLCIQHIYRSLHGDYSRCVVLLILHMIQIWCLFSLSRGCPLAADVVVFHFFFSLSFSIICFAIFVRCHYVVHIRPIQVHPHSWTSNAFFHTHALNRTHIFNRIWVRFTARFTNSLRILNCVFI